LPRAILSSIQGYIIRYRSGLFARDWCWAEIAVGIKIGVGIKMTEMTAKIWILVLLLANYVHTVTFPAYVQKDIDSANVSYVNREKLLYDMWSQKFNLFYKEWDVRVAVGLARDAAAAAILKAKIQLIEEIEEVARNALQHYHWLQGMS
jgi:uncharacterized membrane protein YhiD involved in acid resistance